MATYVEIAVALALYWIMNGGMHTVRSAGAAMKHVFRRMQRDSKRPMMIMAGYWLELVLTRPGLVVRLLRMLLQNELLRARRVITALLTAVLPTGASEYLNGAWWSPTLTTPTCNSSQTSGQCLPANTTIPHSPSTPITPPPSLKDVFGSETPSPVTFGASTSSTRKIAVSFCGQSTRTLTALEIESLTL